MDMNRSTGMEHSDEETEVDMESVLAHDWECPLYGRGVIFGFCPLCDRTSKGLTHSYQGELGALARIPRTFPDLSLNEGDAQEEWYDYAPELYIRNHAVVSSLNGNNGEWTNSDDTAAPSMGEQYDRLIEIGGLDQLQEEDGDDRVQKFRSKKKSSRVDGSKRDRQVNKKNSEARVHKNYATEGEAPPPPQKEEQFLDDRFLIARADDPEGFVYEGYFHTEAMYPVKLPGIYDHVDASGFGWYNEHLRGRSKVFCQSAWRPVEIAEYQNGMGGVPGVRYVLLAAVLDSIDSKLRLSNLTSANLVSAQNLISRTVQSLPMRIIDLHKSYLYELAVYNELKNHRLLSGILTISKRNYFAILDDYDNDAEVSFSFGKPFIIRSVDCPIQFVYEEDKDMKISGDYVLVNDAEGNVHHQLPTELNPKEHWYRTGMFSLEGERKFVEYEKSDCNINSALKRFLSKNSEHDARCYHESFLAKTLVDSSIRHNLHHAGRIAEAASVPRRVQGNSLQLEPYDPDPFLDDLVDFIAGGREAPAALAETKRKHDAAMKTEFAYTETLDDICDHEAVSKASDKMIQLIAERFDRSWVNFVLESVPQMKDWLYYETYLGFMEYIEPIYSRFSNANIPHIKRKLRQMYVKLAGSEATDQIMVQRLEAKVKRELAKAGKASRLYVGYEAGCMYANELPEFYKVAMQKEIVVRENNQMFIIHLMTKPRSDDLDAVFDDIARGLDNNEHIIVIYSDDSVWAGCINHIRYAHNCDIESCDASIKSSGFFLSGLCLGGFDVERAIGLLEQCKLPLTIRSNSDREVKLKIQRVIDKQITPIEGSGTVLTTINNFNKMCVTALTYVYRGIYGTPAAIKRAGVLCGVNLDVSEDFSGCPEKLQFLKCSPILCTDGHYHMIRNTGTLTRGGGKIDGDMEGKHINMTPNEFSLTPWATRMEIFMSMQVQSLKHEISNPILDGFRERFATPVAEAAESFSIIDQRGNKGITALPESIANRYDISTGDLLDLKQVIVNIQLGDIIVSDTLTKIYKVDYGM